jgi:hypothetical protein
MAEFLVALADFDRRKLWLELGDCSLFAFLRRLGVPKSSASYRTKAAELIQRFPVIIEPLRDGRLCLSTVHELSNVLTPENQAEVLPRFFGLSKQEALELVAELKPVEYTPRRDVVTAVRIPAARPAAATVELCAPPANRESASSAAGSPVELVDANSPARTVNAPTSHRERDRVEPLTAELSRLHATLSRRFRRAGTSRPPPLLCPFPGRGPGPRVHAAPSAEFISPKRGDPSTPRRRPATLRVRGRWGEGGRSTVTSVAPPAPASSPAGACAGPRTDPRAFRPG